ncbi:MAG TPA: hypothetical protein VF676_06350 [Flavobacterium sp.]|jgi:hypothetical protein
MRLLYFPLILLIFASCKQELRRESVLFRESQPQGVKSESLFPEYIRGIYVCDEDDSELQITDKMLLQKFAQDINISQLGEDMRVSGDTIIDLKSGERLRTEKINDSVVRTYFEVDTIFEIGKQNALKKFQGKYILNIFKEEDKGWDLIILIPGNRELYLAYVDSLTEAKISEISKTAIDTIQPRYYTLTKQQFRKVLKADAHQYKKRYKKVQ